MLARKRSWPILANVCIVFLLRMRNKYTYLFCILSKNTIQISREFTGAGVAWWNLIFHHFPFCSTRFSRCHPTLNICFFLLHLWTDLTFLIQPELKSSQKFKDLSALWSFSPNSSKRKKTSCWTARASLEMGLRARWWIKLPLATTTRGSNFFPNKGARLNKSGA